MRALPDPEAVCERILGEAGQIGLPIDLRTVCSLWPTLHVAEEDLDKDGYLIPLGVHGAELLVRRQDPPMRKKFTLAHELGHWVLANLQDDQVVFDKGNGLALTSRNEHSRQTPEEIWCNRFAAALLIPRSELTRYLSESNSQEIADLVATGDSKFGVSREAFLTRVAKVANMTVLQVLDTSEDFRISRSFVSSVHRSLDLTLVVATVLEEITKQRAQRHSMNVGALDVSATQIDTSSNGSLWLLCLSGSAS